MTGYDEYARRDRAASGYPRHRDPPNVACEMTNDERDLAPLLEKAGILMFEYDVDGILLSASGSCLGGGDPELEVRMGIVTPGSVRRATGGQMVIEWIRIGDRTIAVHHEPVRGECDHVERVVVTAFDVTPVARELRETSPSPNVVPAFVAAS
jgi:hypothetical protein